MVRLKELFEEAKKENILRYNCLSYKQKKKIIEDKGGIDFIREEASKGNSLEKIGRLLGLRHDDIRLYLLREYDTCFSELKKSEKKPYKSSKDVIDERGGIPMLREYAQKGLSQNKICGMFGLKSGSMVSKYVRDKGYTWRELQDVPD